MAISCRTYVGIVLWGMLGMTRGWMGVCHNECVCAGGRLAGQVVRAVVHWSGISLPVSLTSYSVVRMFLHPGPALRTPCIMRYAYCPNFRPSRQGACCMHP